MAMLYNQRVYIYIHRIIPLQSSSTIDMGVYIYIYAIDTVDRSENQPFNYNILLDNVYMYIQ